MDKKIKTNKRKKIILNNEKITKSLNIKKLF